MLPGTKVVFTWDSLGMIGQPEVINSGDTGKYIGPSNDEGWHLIEPDKFPKSICPVTEDMFQEIDTHSKSEKV